MGETKPTWLYDRMKEGFDFNNLLQYREVLKMVVDHLGEGSYLKDTTALEAIAHIVSEQIKKNAPPIIESTLEQHAREAGADEGIIEQLISGETTCEVIANPIILALNDLIAYYHRNITGTVPFSARFLRGYSDEVREAITTLEKNKIIDPNESFTDRIIFPADKLRLEDYKVGRYLQKRYDIICESLFKNIVLDYGLKVAIITDFVIATMFKGTISELLLGGAMGGIAGMTGGLIQAMWIESKLESKKKGLLSHNPSQIGLERDRFLEDLWYIDQRIAFYHKHRG